MILHPQFRINKAVRIRGKYRVGSYRLPENFLSANTSTAAVMRFGVVGEPWRWFGNNLTNATSLAGAGNQDFISFIDGAWLPNTVASGYQNSELGGTNVAFSPGYWELLWLTAQTPWGIVAMGKRAAPVGMGMLLDGTEVSSESLALVVPYGPLVFVAFGYPARHNDALGGLQGDSSNLRDGKNNRDPEIGAIVQYNAGPMQLGVFFDYNSRHRDGVAGQMPVVLGHARDTKDWIGIAWMKYNNGRFFANAEVAHYDRIRKRTFVIPQYYEDWRYGLEMGLVAGPAKLSLLGAWCSGYDRRAGLLIDRQGIFGGGTLLGNSTVFAPYSNLMVLNYGTGNGGIGVLDHRGNFTDAWGLGARLDYAAAANLNLYASAFWAERVSHGYGWGCIMPLTAPSTVTGALQSTGYTTWDQPINLPVLVWAVFLSNAPFNGTAPSIPDRSLGYEFGAGFDWKLLEGLALKYDFSIWFPGKWFSYACVDRNVANWNAAAPHAAPTWGTNPGRDIDPVYFSSLRFEANF